MSFIPQENVLYRFISALDKDMVLDVSGNQQTANSVILYEWNKGQNQKFAIISVGNNRYSFYCAKNNLTVEVP
jgi:hypothetical protein